MHSKALISNMTIEFSNSRTKHLNKTFLILNLRNFIFEQNFTFRKTRGCWFQIQQELFQISNYSKKYLNKASLVPKRDIFILSRALISNMIIVFSNSNSKRPKAGIFDLKFKDFYFCIKLCNWANLKALISNMIIVQ